MPLVRRSSARAVLDDVGEAVGDEARELDHRPLEPEGDGEVVGGRDAVRIDHRHGRRRRRSDRRIDQAAVGVDHVPGGEGRAVLEFHARLELEGPGVGGVVRGPGFGELRRRGEALVEDDETLIGERDARRVRVAGVEGRIHGRRGAIGFAGSDAQRLRIGGECREARLQEKTAGDGGSRSEKPTARNFQERTHACLSSRTILPNVICGGGACQGVRRCFIMCNLSNTLLLPP